MLRIASGPSLRKEKRLGSSQQRLCERASLSSNGRAQGPYEGWVWERSARRSRIFALNCSRCSGVSTPRTCFMAAW